MSIVYFLRTCSPGASAPGFFVRGITMCRPAGPRRGNNSSLFPPLAAVAVVVRKGGAERFEQQEPHSRTAWWADLRGRISCAEPIFAAGLAPLQILERGANNALLFPPLAALRRCCGQIRAAAPGAAAGGLISPRATTDCGKPQGLTVRGGMGAEPPSL